MNLKFILAQTIFDSLYINSCFTIDVTLLLTFLAQASHELVPPEVSSSMSA